MWILPVILKAIKAVLFFLAFRSAATGFLLGKPCKLQLLKEKMQMPR